MDRGRLALDDETKAPDAEQSLQQTGGRMTPMRGILFLQRPRRLSLVFGIGVHPVLPASTSLFCPATPAASLLRIPRPATAFPSAR
jgi:hypothetical protein